MPKFELPKVEVPSFDLPKVELPKVDLAKVDEVRTEVSKFLADRQDDVVALPGRTAEVVADLRDRAEKRGKDLAGSVAHGVGLVREAVGL